MVVLQFPKPTARRRRRDPEAAPGLLNRRFQAVSRPWDRRVRAAQFRRRTLSRLAIMAALILPTSASLLLSPWPPLLTLQHIAAAPNCSAARMIGLAPAYRGDPGYYDRHDRDKDGWACEPWPPGRSLPEP